MSYSQSTYIIVENCPASVGIAMYTASEYMLTALLVILHDSHTVRECGKI